MQRTAIETSAIAASWLIRLEGEATPELWEELNAWLDESPRHRAAFIRLRTAWNRVDKLKLLRPMDGSIDADVLSKIDIVNYDNHDVRAAQPQYKAEDEREDAGAQAEVPSRGPANDQEFPSWTDAPSGLRTRNFGAEKINSQRRRWLAVAAATAAVAVGVLFFTLRGSAAATYQTEIGGRQEIALTDGSKVDLNTDSELRVRMTATRRDLVLIRGEALFHVAQDTQRPFYVTAGGTVVRAVGTAFSVRIHDDKRVEVLVTEGRVAVGPPDSPDEPTLLPSSATASAGERAVTGRDGTVLGRMRPTDMARKLAWTTGQLSFQGETLFEAVNEFNRYNRRHLLIQDPSIMGKQVGGHFRTTDPDSFVAALERSFGIRVLDSSDAATWLAGVNQDSTAAAVSSEDPAVPQSAGSGDVQENRSRTGHKTP